MSEIVLDRSPEVIDGAAAWSALGLGDPDLPYVGPVGQAASDVGLPSHMMPDAAMVRRRPDGQRRTRATRAVEDDALAGLPSRLLLSRALSALDGDAPVEPSSGVGAQSVVAIRAANGSATPRDLPVAVPPRAPLVGGPVPIALPATAVEPDAMRVVAADAPLLLLPAEPAPVEAGDDARPSAGGAPLFAFGPTVPKSADDRQDRAQRGRADPGSGELRMAGGPVDIDWQVIVTLRRRSADMIAGRAADWADEHGVAMPDLDRRLMGRSIIRGCVRDHVEQLNRSGQALWPLSQEQAYARAVEDAIFGYGRLQPLFEHSEAENIEIHGFDCVVVQDGDGRRHSHPPVADSDEELVEAIRFLGQTASPPRPFDDAHPMMTLALGDRFRLHAIGFGLVDRPSITIRQHLLTEVSLDDLAGTGMLTRQVADFLTAAVRARLSIVISGDQGAGKTTLLRALIDAIPSTERFGTLETDYELLTHLRPDRRNVVALQSRQGMGERVDGRQLGEYTVADLMPEALRQNLARLIVGEVRGVEAAAMFEAMQAGAGTMSTTHSHSAASTIDRLASRVAQGGVLGVADAYRQIAYNVGLIIHVRLVDDTWRGGVRRRFIDEILHVTGGVENGRPITELVYQADDEGNATSFVPSSQLVEQLRPYIRRRANP